MQRLTASTRELSNFMANDKCIHVEVAYATPLRQLIVPLEVSEGCTMVEAVYLSNICKTFPEIDLENLSLGIFGKAEKAPETSLLKAGDRVEIYRPLVADPKEVRKNRAAKLKEKKKASAP